MQQPDILKMCPGPTLPGVAAPLNSLLWASPQPRLSSAHSAQTSLLRLRLWHPLTSALPTQDAFRVASMPHCAHFQLRLAPHPTFRLIPDSGSPRVQPQSPAPATSQPSSPKCSPPRRRPRPAPGPLGSYQQVPPARRKRRAANRRLPHCGPSGAGGLGPPAAGPPGLRRVSAGRGCVVAGLASAVPTESRPSSAVPTSPRRHAPPPPSTVSGRGAAAHRGPPS